jgi:hypothetical protein
VEFKQYLEDLCKDLSGLLCEDGAGTDIVVEGMKVHLPSTFAIPLGLITNELITNSVKYAKGCIIVRPGIMVEGRDLASHFPVLKPVAAQQPSVPRRCPRPSACTVCAARSGQGRRRARSARAALTVSSSSAR